MFERIKEKILFPLGASLEEAKSLICNASYGQFYFGISEPDLGDCSLSHHYSSAGAFLVKDALELLRLAEEHGRKISLAINITFFTEHSMERIFRNLDILLYYPVDFLIIGNIEVFMAIQKRYPFQKCAASSLFGIKNTESAAFFCEIGFKKIIFPRNIQIKEIKSICDYCGTEVETEAFIFGGGCVFCEGTCCLPHVYLGDVSGSYVQDIKRLRPYPICNMASEIYMNGEFDTIRRLEFGNRDCGLCYVNILDQLNVSSFKVTGRTFPVTKRKELMQMIEKCGSLSPEQCKKRQETCLYEKESYANLL